MILGETLSPSIRTAKLALLLVISMSAESCRAGDLDDATKSLNCLRELSKQLARARRRHLLQDAG